MEEYNKLHEVVMNNIEELGRVLQGTGIPELMIAMLKDQIEELKTIVNK